MTRVLIVILAFIVAACGDNPLEPDDSGSIAGIWTGAVQEEYGGPGTLRLELRDDDWGFGGTFSLMFAEVSRSRSGTVTGEYATPFLPSRMSLTTAAEPCATFADGTTHHQLFNWAVEDGRLRGAYTAVGCALGDVLTTTGSFEVTRLE
jgi:hypothetical protein